MFLGEPGNKNPRDFLANGRDFRRKPGSQVVKYGLSRGNSRCPAVGLKRQNSLIAVLWKVHGLASYP